jgi:transposase
VDTLSLGIWPEEGVLMGRPSKFSPEFGEQAVELVRATGKTIAEVARDLQINDTTLGNWVKADRAERGEPDSSGLLPLTAEERAGLNGTVRLWNTTDPAAATQLGAPLTGHDGAAHAVAFAPAGHTLASAGDDGTVRLWNLTGLTEPFPVTAPPAR